MLRPTVTTPFPGRMPKQGDSLLGKYTLDEPLGKGGMGIVYGARHDLLGQRVAVKFLLPEVASHADSVTRFLNEARAASRIESDHIARVLDVGLVDGSLPYMVLEFLDGDDLAAVLRKRGPLPFADVADYMMETIEAVACAHSLGIIHRDLKPSNLFLARRKDGTARVKVLDFGISKMIDVRGGAGDITRTNALLGSPLYMSPEQLRNSKNVDHRADIWSLGVIAYELLTQHPPFMADNAVALFAAIQEAEPATPRSLRPAGSIPPELEAAVLRCLRRDASQRFASVSDLGAALVPFCTDAGKRAFETTKRTLPPSPPNEVVAASKTSVLPPIPPASTTTTPSISAPTKPSVYASTQDPWTRSRGGGATSARRGILAAVAVLGAIGALVALGAKYVLRDGIHGTVSGTAVFASSSAPPVSSQSAAPSTAMAGAPSSIPSSAPVSTPVSEIAATPSAKPSASAAAPAPHAIASATPHVLSPIAGTTNSRKPPPPSKCEPPYVIDPVSKIQLWKSECL